MGRFPTRTYLRGSPTKIAAPSPSSCAVMARRCAASRSPLAAKPQTPTMLPRIFSSCCGRRPNSWQPGKAAFTTWLYRVVANRCLDQARRQRVRRWLPFEDVADPVDETPSALDALSDRDRLAEVRKMILTLPEKPRLALLLAVQGEQSNAEIASILGVSEGAAEQLLVRARRRLRALVADQEVAA